MKIEKYLITQENLQKDQGGLWKFSEEKIEINETGEEAITIELKEELDIKVDNYLKKIFNYRKRC